MKKRKITYSLTARQKRELNEKKQSTAPAEGEETAVKRRPNVGLIVSIVAVALASVMIVLAIFIPIWVTGEKITNDTFINWKYHNASDPDNPYTDANPNPNEVANPLATIKVTGDDKAAFSAIFGEEEISLEFEIFMDSAPYSGMNFMYLAENGFYDDTIICDVNAGHAMLNGYTQAKDSSNRTLQPDFMRNLKGFTEHNISSSDVNSDYKLGYRLKPETKRSTVGSSSGSMGYLVMLASSLTSYSTSTAFMMFTDQNPQLTFSNNGQSVSSCLSWMGKSNNEETDEFLRKLNGIQTALSGNFFVPTTTVRIKSIRTDLSGSRRSYLLNNFESLISDGGLSMTTWRTIPYNDENYTFGE